MARVTGDRDLARQLQRLMEDAEDICVEALQGWADAVQASAEVRAPRLTGALENQLSTAVDRSALVARVGILEAPYEGGSQNPSVYAPLIEGGTERLDAQPFLQPAFDRHSDIRPYVRLALDRRLP